MASPYQVNITISAGVDFAQQFTIQNPDGSPVNLDGCKFFANLAKHPTAIDAAVSTSGNKVYAYVPFDAAVFNADLGVYELRMSAERTSLLEEGKYVYNVVMQDTTGDKTSVLGGLSFVEVAFGITK